MGENGLKMCGIGRLDGMFVIQSFERVNIYLRLKSYFMKPLIKSSI
jgi:hypothetical protein